MEYSSCWQVLQLHRQNAPRLLVRYHFHDLGYQIYITDYSRIWGESLAKAECIQRAAHYGSSIDPSQDDEQLHILLDKIRTAVDQESGTTLQLNSQAKDGKELSVEISASLPKPLAPLNWTLQLQLLDPSQVQIQLVAPLLKQAIHLQHQVEHLVGELQSKDRVISKICDRLETSGNDLTTVFPGASNIKTSRKRGQREQLANHVKGLGDFDEDAWRARSDTTDRQVGVADADLNGVLGRLRSPDIGIAKNDTKSWWTKLSALDDLPCREITEFPNRIRDHQMLDQNGVTQDNEFQRQVTPPHLRHSAQKEEEDPPLDSVRGEREIEEANGEHADDSSTEDEDDLDTTLRAQLVASETQKRIAHKLVLPTQEREATGEQTEKAQPAPILSKKLGAIGGRSAQPPAASSVAQDSASERSSADVRSRGKLGAVGENSTEPTPAAMDTDTSETQHVTSAPDKRRKMGVLGGKKGRESPHKPDAEEANTAMASSPSAGTTNKQPTPPLRETSQERADKKRDQLKRELDDKAKAPVKKKRKF